jgi:hypothetical protein
LFSKDLRDLIVVNRVKTTLPLLITKKKNTQFYFAQMVEAPENLSGENYDISVTA